MDTYLQEILGQIKTQGLFRTLNSLESAQEPVVTVGGNRVIQFCSNNYLGLANHPELKKAAVEALEEYGVGAGASRLIAGNFELYEKLERRLSRFKGTEAAIVFPTGYQANVGSISVLMGPEDVIFSDALNHASIIDGCRLSGAPVLIYPHRDVDSLEKMLRSAPRSRNRLIVTDGVFSMDGTIGPLPDLAALAARYGCWLMVDEAHATGVLGKHGSGTAEHFGVEKDIAIHMGTFSKAFGSLGGYIAGSRNLIGFLTNRCRSLMYTTGLPPAVLAVNHAAIDLVEGHPELREGIWRRAAFVREELGRQGFDTLESETQIIPVVMKDPVLTMQVSHYLSERGILAHGIRPPTVPEGLSRIRLAVMATHEWDDLRYGVETLTEAGKRFGII
jgi:8-amino-7-oxononanoate synthase